MTKLEIREKMRALRRQVTPEARVAYARQVAEALWARPDVQGAIARRGIFAVYLASPDEIDLAPFMKRILAAGAKIVAPRWNGKGAYTLAIWKPGDEVVGPHAILEPRAEAAEIEPARVDVWLVPGLAFTKAGDRVGYGGGWYDRLLSRANPTASRVGIAYPFQILRELPAEVHDCKLTDVI